MSHPRRTFQDVERVDLAELEHEVQRQWHSEGGAVVTLGASGDRWFARHSRKGAAWVFAFERSACELVDQWLARGTWHEIGLPPRSS